jgi:hypothetical protein
MRDFNAIDAEAQPRNITAWTPVVTEILQGCCRFEDDSVRIIPPVSMFLPLIPWLNRTLIWYSSMSIYLSCIH